MHFPHLLYVLRKGGERDGERAELILAEVGDKGRLSLGFTSENVTGGHGGVRPTSVTMHFPAVRLYKGLFSSSSLYKGVFWGCLVALKETYINKLKNEAEECHPIAAVLRPVEGVRPGPNRVESDSNVANL